MAKIVVLGGGGIVGLSSAMLLARPGLADHIVEVAGARPPSVPRGPSREDVLRILA
jgi:glycine/D-amino acid oxidase-like deaminating enzyme